VEVAEADGAGTASKETGSFVDGMLWQIWTIEGQWMQPCFRGAGSVTEQEGWRQGCNKERR
jgi:hypothetical protein